ncbi:MAG TPA: hypothetical protein VHA33_17830 [Candidatus Angelobacter sp.]|jgi:hypothetical protein|nr:hypothetical protein [Candidatus Angelobacter sp.]
MEIPAAVLVYLPLGVSRLVRSRFIIADFEGLICTAQPTLNHASLIFLNCFRMAALKVVIYKLDHRRYEVRL